MSARPRSATAALALVLALALAGCGGSHTVTKQQVIARGNAICVGALRQIRSVPAGSASLSGLGAYLRRVVPIVAREADQLRALPRPAKGRALLERYVAAVDGDLAQYRVLLAAARAGDSGGVNQALANLRASSAGSLAARYGLTQCVAPAGTAVS